MRTIALYMHCERWITVRLRRNYKMIGSRKVRNPGILKELWRSRGSNHMRAAYCWRQKLRLETSLRFILARFANLVDLDEISQWLSAFCKL